MAGTPWLSLIVLAIVISTAFRATGGFRADVHPGAVETTLAGWATSWYIWHAAGNSRNPVPPTKDNVSLGKAIFGADCAICHGLDGHGAGAIGPMNPPIANLAAPYSQHWTDAQLYWIIEHGIRFTGMPAWRNSVNSHQTWLMVDFIRSLKAQPVPRKSSAK